MESLAKYLDRIYEVEPYEIAILGVKIDYQLFHMVQPNNQRPQSRRFTEREKS